MDVSFFLGENTLGSSLILRLTVGLHNGRIILSCRQYSK